VPLPFQNRKLFKSIRDIHFATQAPPTKLLNYFDAQNNYNISVIFHLLDDFLTINKPDECGERTMALLSLIFNKLNIPLSPKKTIGPVCELEYLGIILDTIKW
jgi:hypothetical protein